ncbi:MAG: hypothetical protein AABY10_05925, partial [Nanoarchaeota archaeon]
MNTKTEWDFSTLFKKEEDMEQEKEKVEKEVSNFVEKWKNNSDFLSSPEKLKEALDDYEKLIRKAASGGKAHYYYWLKTQQDQNSSELKAKYNKINEFAIKISNDLQFFTLNISKIKEDNQKIFLSSPILSEYKHYLEKAFIQSKYLLSEGEEKILNLKSKTSHENWDKMLSLFLSKEERNVFDESGSFSKKNFSEISSLLQSTKKEVRDSYADALNDILEKNIDVAEQEINSILEDKKINDELRGFSRPDQNRHISDDLSTEVVNSLVKSVTDNFEISKKYYKLKASLFNVGKLEYHERNVPYGKIEKEFSFEESSKLINKVFHSLDPEFSKIFSEFLKEGKVDVFPKKGKRYGAFCIWISPEFPMYVMLNHTKKLNDVLTIAHEFGLA